VDKLVDPLAEILSKPLGGHVPVTERGALVASVHRLPTEQHRLVRIHEVVQRAPGLLGIEFGEDRQVQRADSSSDILSISARGASWR
jgi:hypothetical protein